MVLNYRKQQILTLKIRIMEFVFMCVIYILVCKGICKLFGIESFNKQALIFAIVGSIWKMIV